MEIHSRKKPRTKKSVLAVNDSTPASTEDMQSVICNLLPSQCRYEMLEGRQHMVIPMIILTEGVHTGSQGTLLYPKDELSKTPAAWNHKPVVVYHPEMNGKGVSACDPVVLNNRKVGVMLNTKFEKGKLKSEAWIEKSLADRVDERIMEAITANEMMELSTGVFVDVEEKEGKWNGENYTHVARNYRPDHLALLPDMVGACSIADGAGFLRNQSGAGNPTLAALRKALVTLGIVGNELSYSNTQSALSEALNAKYGSDPSTPGNFIWVASVYSNFFIYEKDGKLFRLGYTADDTGATLGEETPVEVVRVTEYRTVDGAFVGNQHTAPQPPTQNKDMNKKQKVDALIANSKGSFTEEDRVRLDAFTETQLDALAPAPAPAPTPAAVVGNAAVIPFVPTPAPVAPPAPKTMEEFISGAPEAMRDVLHNSVRIHNEEKTKLVDALLANKNNEFTKEELNHRPLGELQRLARLASVEVPAARVGNYSGQAPVPAANSQVEEALELPTVTYASRK